MSEVAGIISAVGDDQLRDALDRLLQEVAVRPGRYEEARNRYAAVGEWLGKDDSPLAMYAPEIYPQGSFALGTATRPLGDGEYDVDAVCELQVAGQQLSPQQLKKLVGERLRAHGTYERMLDPPDGGRRCWTLRYAEESKFHVDVLPAIPDMATRRSRSLPHPEHAIAITDREQPGQWPPSNPRGFAEWFRSRMQEIFEEKRASLAEEMFAEIADIPDHEVATPLQGMVQLLKRHRDEMFGDDEDKPISIIITTLAALAYQNEHDVLSAMTRCIPRLRDHIDAVGGVCRISNPTNPKENFADKWLESPRKRALFYQWLDAVEQLCRDMATAGSMEKVGSLFSESFGEDYAARAFAEEGDRQADPGFSPFSAPLIPPYISDVRFNVPHRDPPPAELAIRGTVSLRAVARARGWRTLHLSSDDPPMHKNYSLQFEAVTEIRGALSYYWQVVNTGSEAEARGATGLRGHVRSGWRIQRERTLYRGAHSIECFIVQDGQVVARTGEFVINIM